MEKLTTSLKGLLRKNFGDAPLITQDSVKSAAPIKRESLSVFKQLARGFYRLCDRIVQNRDPEKVFKHAVQDIATATGDLLQAILASPLNTDANQPEPPQVAQINAALTQIDAVRTNNPKLNIPENEKILEARIGKYIAPLSSEQLKSLQEKALFVNGLDLKLPLDRAVRAKAKAKQQRETLASFIKHQVKNKNTEKKSNDTEKLKKENTIQKKESGGAAQFFLTLKNAGIEVNPDIKEIPDQFILDFIRGTPPIVLPGSTAVINDNPTTTSATDKYKALEKLHKFIGDKTYLYNYLHQGMFADFFNIASSQKNIDDSGIDGFEIVPYAFAGGSEKKYVELSLNHQGDLIAKVSYLWSEMVYASAEQDIPLDPEKSFLNIQCTLVFPKDGTEQDSKLTVDQFQVDYQAIPANPQ